MDSTPISPAVATAASIATAQLTLSAFDNVHAQTIAQKQTSWKKLCKLVTEPPEYPNKQSMPLLKLAGFGDVRTMKGSLRHNDNLLFISGIEADYDAGIVSISTAADKIAAAGIAACLYTTPSHTDAAPRWRVLVGLSAQYSPGERKRFVKALDNVLGGILAPESYTAAQAFYFGKVAGALYEVRIVEGEALDVVLERSADGGAHIGESTLVPDVRPGFGALPDHIVSSHDPIMHNLLQEQPKSMAVILRKSFDGTGCSQLKDICDPDTQKNQDYLRWRAGLSIAANTVDADTAIQEVSQHGKGYDAAETRRKAADLIGKPYRCSTFAATWPELCANCAHAGRITSPIQLGVTDEAGDALPRNDAATVQRLATLPKMQYDRVRAKEAKAMGVRTSTLDELVNAAREGCAEAGTAPFREVEPWPDPVDPADLLQQITELVQRFVVCDRHTAHATALWVVLTWFAEDVEVLPLANITAPEKRCGKSTLLFLMSRLVRKPLAASNISPAALFRAIDKWGPTILLDEADAFIKDNEELRGLINSGHTRDSAFVIRVVGEDFQPVRFNTWGPKVLCGIGKLADTLTDRSICLELRRRLPHETVERLRHADSAQFETMARQLARFAHDYGTRVRDARPVIPDSLHDRAADNWEGVLAIADLAGGEWPELARAAALAISGDTEAALSVDTELLQDIQEVWAAHRKDRIFSAWLVQALCNDPDRRWATYNRGQPITPRQVAARLKNYGIAPQTVRIDAERAKGYLKEQFVDVFARYLPGIDENAVTA